MASRSREFESRHIILSSARGMVTEIERVTMEQYVVRCHKSSADAGVVLDVGSWIGFRYHDEHWSFIER